MKRRAKKQGVFNYKQKNPAKLRDDFAQSIKPLEELLDSVRHLDGFPLAADEDILALSDPPYYTACPNPYLNDFIERYSKPYDPDKDDYHRTPFVGDVSEGKNNPIYNAHSYHTKVPHKAIKKFIEHYTEEGDIVFDGFCGSGMTGVAAQLLNRRAILVDICPAATFIAYNYNTSVAVDEFEQEATRILEEVEKECGWMYETIHTDGKTKGRINYTVWSDVFICPYCRNEYSFWQAAVDKEKGRVQTKYDCPQCKAQITKRECERGEITFFDQALGQDVTQAKQVPVLINYSVGKKRFEKEPDQFDLDLIQKIEDSTIPYWFPTNRMPAGDESRRNDRMGITHVHHFYTKRSLWVLSCMYYVLQNSIRSRQSLLILTSFMVKTGSRLHNIGFKKGRLNLAGAMPNTLYMPSSIAERNILDLFETKTEDILNVFSFRKTNRILVSCASSTHTNLISNSGDYIFTDPPFGENIMYSELSFIWEAWLKVFTNNEKEAIVNRTQNKGLEEYKALMTACFKEMYRILKPNRWLTVVFHNSRASVWNAIQASLNKAGFIVAQVAVLNKKQGTFNQMTSPGTVKNDLIINAYKPKQEFSDRFLKSAGQGMEQDFIAQHLSRLPIGPNIERTGQMLYSKLLAHYVRRGYLVRYSARQFHRLLGEHFKRVDGFWFTEEQLPQYEEWKMALGLEAIEDIKAGQLQAFITDENSALTWIYQFLGQPRSYSDIYTAYNKAVTVIEDEIPELRDLLDNNFIFENGLYRRPQTKDEHEAVEARRERELERAFDQLLVQAQGSGRRLRNVRKEALKYGFTKAYQEQRFADILAVAEKLSPKP